jgi:voltage-gated potassium channel Kch
MAVSPLLFIALDRLVLPRVTACENKREQDTIEHAERPVIIAGFGRFGQIVGRLLRANNIEATILDLDPGIVDLLGRLGVKVYYGDAARPDLLHAAGCARAKLFVLAVDDVEQSEKIAEAVRRHFPELPILGRARNRTHYYSLKRLGVEHVFRETFASALEMGVRSLMKLGYRAHTAHRLAKVWRQQEERALENLGKLWGGDEKVYFDAAKKALDEAERLMRKEDPAVYRELDAAWDNESLREEVRSRAEGEAPP